MDDENSIYEGYVILENGFFKKVGKGTPEETEFTAEDQIIDGKGKWLLPGLINTHGHLGSSYLRGAGDDMPLMEWLETVMWPNESKFSKETVKNASLLALLEMTKTGTTTFLDMYHLHMAQMAELAIESELRAVLCRGMIGFCSEEEQDEKIAESVWLYKNYNGANNDKIAVAMSPHAPYTSPPTFLMKVRAAAEQNGMWIHTHVSETKGEVIKHIEQFGKSPVKHLDEIGLFDVPCLIAHGVHLNEEDLNILQKKNVSVSHNPMSNLKLGSGIAPLPEMLKRGINVAIGTDSTASNNNLDMLEEIRFTAMIHKGVKEDPTVTTSEKCLRMAMEHGAKALQIEGLGRIQEGYKADFIMINPFVPHLLPSDHNRIASHLVYAAKGSDVTDSFVGGIQVMKDKETLFLDEEKILYEAQNFHL